MTSPLTVKETPRQGQETKLIFSVLIMIYLLYTALINIPSNFSWLANTCSLSEPILTLLILISQLLGATLLCWFKESHRPYQRPSLTKTIAGFFLLSLTVLIYVKLVY